MTRPTKIGFNGRFPELPGASRAGTPFVFCVILEASGTHITLFNKIHITFPCILHGGHLNEAMAKNNGPHAVFFTFKADIHEGKLDDFKAVGKEMVEWVKEKDPGCIRYDWNISDDGKACHLQEGYVNSEAVLAHMNIALGPFSERLFQTCTPTGIYFYSPVTDAVKEAVAAFNPVYFDKFLVAE